MKIQKQAFSLIEVIVGVVIFLIGISSVYAIMRSTISTNALNKNYIIASNLAREQIELVRNIRDTNFKKIQAYNIREPLSENYDEVFTLNTYYKVENDFSNTATNPVKITEEAEFKKGEINLAQNTIYQLCINDENLYVYCNGDTSLTKTNFYKYIKVEKVIDKNGEKLEGAFKVKSEIIWYSYGYHSFYIDAIFTDYKIF